jgi:hypothetical protein
MTQQGPGHPPAPQSQPGWGAPGAPPPQQQGWGQPGYRPPPPPKKSHTKRNVILAVVGTVVLLSIIGSLGSDDTSAPTPATDALATPDTSARATPETAAPAPASKPPDEPTPAALGTEVRDGKFAFKVTRVQRGVSSVGGQFGEQAQGAFTIVTLRVQNIGDQSQTFDAGNQKAYAGSTAYEADGGASLYANEGSRSFLEDINPGNSITVRVVFDTPMGKKLDKIELHDSALSGGVEAAL